MRTSRVLSLLFLSLIVFCSCSDIITSDSEVVQLFSETFTDAIKDNKYVLVEFYAPWCGHCKNLEPEYERAANILKEEGSNIVLAKVDGSAEAEQGLSQMFRIQGFPTLFFFKDGRPTNYNGPRTAEGIVAWLHRKTGPSTVTIDTAESLSTYITSNPVSIIGYFTEDSPEYTGFVSAAGDGALENFNVAVITDADVAKSAGISLNQVQVNRTFDEPAVLDASSKTVQQIVNFISGSSYPYLDAAPVSWSRLREKGLPIGLLIFDDKAEDAEEIRATVTQVAKDMSDTFGFATVGPEYLDKSAELGGTGKKMPTIIVVNQKQQNYPYSDDSEFTATAIKEWATGIITGTVKPHFKSEPVPETNDESVLKLVGSTFDDLVLNSGKTTFVEFYAPWCGHCKSLEPVWEQLGEHYKDSSKVVIAKIDSTLNDNSAIQVQGFPTLYLFPAGNTAEPIEFKGAARTFEELVTFIDQHVGEESHGHQDL